MSNDLPGCHWHCAFCANTLPNVPPRTLPRCPFCGMVQPGFHVDPGPSQSLAAGAENQGNPQRGTGGGDSTLEGSRRQVIPTPQQMQETQRMEMSHGPQQPLSHEQQQLLQYEQQLVGKEKMLKQRYDQEVQRLRSMELNSHGQQLGHDQQQQLIGQRMLCQQFWDDLQIVWKQQQELRHKFMLGGESPGQQMSYDHQQQRTFQQQRILQQGGQWSPQGHGQQQHNQQRLPVQQQLQAPQQILRAENQQWLGGDQQQEYEQRRLLEQQRMLQQQQEHKLSQYTSSLNAQLSLLDIQQQQLLHEQQKKIEGQRRLEHQQAMQQQQQRVTIGHGQQPSIEQQRHHEQQQEMLEQLRRLQQKLKQTAQQQADEGGQQPSHDQQEQNEREIQTLQQQIRSLQQQILQYQGVGGKQTSHDQRKQHEHQLQQSRVLQQHQVEGNQPPSDDQQGQYEQRQEMLEQQQQQQLQHRPEQPTDGQYQPTGDLYMENLRNQVLAWQRMSLQEQDSLQQEQQRMQEHQRKLEQRQRMEQQHEENEQMSQSQHAYETQDITQAGDVVYCDCGAAFHPGARVCGTPNCGKPRPRNQPQGPPCVYCHKPLMKEGATKCVSCNKKQPETPTKPPEGAGTGIPPPPGLAQPGGVQPRSTTEMIVSPASLPCMFQSSMVFGEAATVPPYVMTSIKGHQPEIHPGGKQNPSAGDTPSASLSPNTHQKQGSSTHITPSTGVPGALPSSQGNDSQARVRQSPGVPDSARPTKDTSTSGQNSVTLPNTQPCAKHPSSAEDTATQSPADVSTNQKRTTQVDDNNNRETTSGASGKPANHTADTDDRNKSDSATTHASASTGRPPESQSTLKADSGDTPNPSLDDTRSHEDSKKATGENNKGNQNGEKNNTHSTSANKKSYAAATKVFTIFSYWDELHIKFNDTIILLYDGGMTVIPAVI